MKIAFYDLETQNEMSDVRGDHTKLLISVGCLRIDKQNHFYHDKEVEIKQLIHVLRSADLIVTFNGINFDNLVLRGYVPDLDLTSSVPQYDIMKEIQDVIDRRVSLDHVIKQNLQGFEKLGSGRQALIWWKQICRCREEQEVWRAQDDEGQVRHWFERELEFWRKLEAYCESDVMALAKMLGRIVVGMPVKIQRYWDNSFELMDITLRNPLE
jgi:uncharacterized protein YprB with RNaseH-like and TPR domain